MNNINTPENFIQSNSPDGGFLQSEEWRKFQESVGRKTFHLESEGFSANIIEHQLPLAGKYFYIPRGPVIQSSAFPFPDSSGNSSKPSFFYNSLSELIELARKSNVGWIRIEPENDEVLDVIRKNINKVEPFSVQGSTLKIKKAPHDMQPKEILVMDITKSEEELLAGMKQKTRYNIKIAQKHGISVRALSNKDCHPEFISGSQEMLKQVQHDIDYYINEFIRLVNITAKRGMITPHPESYYRKMFEAIPSDILKLYVAEYEGGVIAANLMVFYGKTATYLHGASDNKFRNVMAPYLLQWQAILDAKKMGCEKYDFGGIATKNLKSKIPNPKQIQNSIPPWRDKIQNSASNSWHGITKFKTGFAPNTRPIEFPGSYDIVIKKEKYRLYLFLQRMINLKRLF